MLIHTRLVYQQAEINLLDDPLAALDAEVGQAVFHQVIGSSGQKSFFPHNVYIGFLCYSS